MEIIFIRFIMLAVVFDRFYQDGKNQPRSLEVFLVCCRMKGFKNVLEQVGIFPVFLLASCIPTYSSFAARWRHDYNASGIYTQACSWYNRERIFALFYINTRRDRTAPQWEQSYAGKTYTCHFQGIQPQIHDRKPGLRDGKAHRLARV